MCLFVCFHVGFFVVEIDSGVMENNETQTFFSAKADSLFGPKAAFSDHDWNEQKEKKN